MSAKHTLQNIKFNFSVPDWFLPEGKLTVSQMLTVSMDGPGSQAKFLFSICFALGNQHGFDGLSLGHDPSHSPPQVHS
jgi:hypothetical protein